MTTPLHHLFLLLLLLPTSSHSLTEEGNHLLTLVSTLTSPSPLPFSTWNPTDPTPCNWAYVTCSSSTLSVTALSLSSLSLSGPFPSALCLIPSLTHLDLSNNSFASTLPSSSLLPCSSLAHLDLSQNLLVGPLPQSLPSLPSLLHLDLSGNNFSGPIPPEFGLFPRLENLSLVGNLLTFKIPGFLGNVSSLRQLNLSYNPFAPGVVPAEFGNLTKLEILWVAGCNLVGSIPSSVGGLRSLRNLDVSYNRLEGEIPPEVSMLSDAFQIELYGNFLSGGVPEGLGNLTKLRNFDASMNRLVGTVPFGLFELPELESLNLYQNRLVGTLPVSVSKAVKLSELRLFENKFTGLLPRDLGSNSPLVFVDVTQNFFSGRIPEGICDMGRLEELMLMDNVFSGSLPEGLGRCRTMQRLRLSHNLLSGEVPAGLWGLPDIYLLDLAGNSLAGNISPVISGGSNITKLVLSDNRFTGSIPEEMRSLSKLNEFTASNNMLTGPLPTTLGELGELEKLDLHGNSLTGELLRGIKLWIKLSELNLASNQFTGTIPPELGDLPVLNYLDLSDNLLTGAIPIHLQNLKLNMFNLSNNQLSGKIPPLYANKNYKDSFLGNPGLCGDLEGLCPDEKGNKGKNHASLWLPWLIILLAGFVFIAGCLLFYWRKWNWNFIKESKGKDNLWTLRSFHKLGFREDEVLDCLDEDGVIGTGASGKVYKAVLSNGEAVAVKKLWGVLKEGEQENHSEKRSSTDDSFEAEVATLGKIRHKNIVRLWCCCIHKDCKLLVYEYMPNGSLGDVLHSSKRGLLDWPTRYKIAQDAAEGLAYLHHDCVPPIVHRDVKSNNILLDADFGARVADFGVAKIVDTIGKRPKSMSVVAGSCGYIAPEYAYTLRVNEKSDIFSFGVVILELVTGKPAIDPDYGERDLVKWVCGTLELKGLEHVLDQKIDACFREEMHKVLNIGLQCTSALPINRPSMRRVVSMLVEVKAGAKTRPGSDGRMSPYYYEDSSDQRSTV